MSNRWILAWPLCVGLALAFDPGAAHAQDLRRGGTAMTTGFFARTSFSITSPDPTSLQFAPTDHHVPAYARPHSGKELGMGQRVLAGASLGIHIDASWFYARLGADVYEAPQLTRADYRSLATTMPWIAAGPRFVIGTVSLLAGFRLGMLLMSVRENTPANLRYSAVEGVYAAEIGAQWRPLRWLEVDLLAGLDFGNTHAMFGSVAINLGWSRAPGR